MKASNRIIVNTLAQYARTIINLVLSLYSARLVLQILGEDDYGIYALIGGVVAMLSFFTNSLVSSTQRFLSVGQGRGNLEELKRVFSSSLLLHIILGLVVTVILECLTPFLFNGFLNIPADRIDAATIVYQQVVVMVYVSFVSAPYKALLVSRENIIYTSIIDVADGALKVVLVLLLPFIPLGHLVAYGWIMLFITVFEFFCYSVYTHRHYEECVLPRWRHLTREYVRQLMAFTGWITYSTLCITLRNQGLAIILNRIKGPVINAAYGIGMQICGMVSFVSTSLTNAIAPQLMASEGGADREKMLFLAEMNSKFSYLLLAGVGIPVMFEMDVVLRAWLGQVPQYTSLFGCMFLIMMIVDMLTTGLSAANNAVGRIGRYVLIDYTPKLLAVPLCWLAIYRGCDMWAVPAVMVGVEALCMLIRLPLSQRIAGFSMGRYCRNVFGRVLVPTLVSVAVCAAVHLLSESVWRFLLTFLLSLPAFAVAAYRFSLVDMERRKIDSLLIRIHLKKIISPNQ